MGTRQTLDVLQSYASLLAALGDHTGADAVRALAAALSVAADTAVKSTVAKVSKLWTLEPQSSASPIGLGSRLQALQNLLSVGGAKTASADVALLAQLLQSREAVEPNEFERRLRDSIAAPVPKLKKSKAPKRVPLSEAELREYADRLTAVSADQSAFEAELSTLQSIPKLSVEELRSVAERFVGHEVTGSKAKILKTLRTRQKQDAIEAGRLSRIERLAV